MKRFFNLFGRLLVLLVFLGAAWLLYHYVTENKYLREHPLQKIRDALLGIPPWRLVAAALLTVLNYVILIGYDWFAVRWVGVRDLAVRKIALASFTGYAFSYNFGATLFGTSIRYRLYSAWGVPLIKIVELLIILGLTFWFGLLTLAGVVFMATPLPLPAQLRGLMEWLHLPFTDTFWLGVALLAVAVGYVALSALHRKPFRFFRWHIPLPPLKLTLYQIAIACGDLMVAAAVMFVVLPPVEGGYLKVLGIFMLAFVVGVLSHVPSGAGVFEYVLLKILPEEQAPAVVAAIIAFRVIYYWVPLAMAGTMLGCNEFALSADAAEQPPAEGSKPGSG
jgi:phosphatidylglycerol lysyltransferase